MAVPVAVWLALGATTRTAEHTAGPSASPFQHGRFTHTDGIEYAYSVYSPPGLTMDDRLPLIVFLHGFGERGTPGNEDYLKVGLPSAVRLLVRKRQPPAFIALFPQSQSGQWPARSVESEVVGRIRRRVEAEHPVDPRRVYLTGISDGGTGTWNLAATDPGGWAAIAPVCGQLPADEAGQLAQVPTWCFHGTADEVIAVDQVRAGLAAIRAAGGQPQVTEFPELDHAIWGKVYYRQDLYDWLFACRLPPAG